MRTKTKGDRDWIRMTVSRHILQLRGSEKWIKENGDWCGIGKTGKRG